MARKTICLFMAVIIAIISSISGTALAETNKIYQELPEVLYMISQGMPVQASSENSEGGTAKKVYVNDGNAETHWASMGESAAWIYIDLGKSISIKYVKAIFGRGWEGQNILYVSDDASNWTPVASGYGSQGEYLRDASVPAGGKELGMVIPEGTSGRYLKLQTKSWVRICELQVYSQRKEFIELPEGLNLISQGRPVTASTNNTAEGRPEYAVDGNITTKWGAYGAAEIYVDLGKIYKINYVKINFNRFWDGTNKLYVSNDRINWTEVASWDGSKYEYIKDKSITDGNSPNDAGVLLNGDVNGKYIKLVTKNWANLYEFQVYSIDEAVHDIADKTALYALINTTETLLAKEIAGYYQVGAKDELRTAVDNAYLITNDLFSAQEQVDNEVMSLQAAVNLFKAKKNSTSKIGLYDLITVAENLLQEAVEGGGSLEYQYGAKAELQTAIDLAYEALENITTTDAEALDAKSSLQQAIDIFKTKRNLNNKPYTAASEGQYIISQNKQVMASNYNEAEKGDAVPEKLVDGKDSSYWAAKSPAWAYVDLGKKVNITHIDISFARNWKGVQTIQASDDGQNWYNVVEIDGTRYDYVENVFQYDGSKPNKIGFSMSGIEAKYIKLITQAWANIYEMKVYTDYVPSIVSIASVEKQIYQNEPFALPETVGAEMDDGSIQNIQVQWSGIADTFVLGEQTFTGLINGYEGTVTYMLTVKPITDYLQILPQFENPGNEYRAYKINHNMPDEVRYTEVLQKGYGGVVSNVPWGDSYLEDDQAFINLQNSFTMAREMGLNTWIYDENFYPSGRAGGLVVEGNPEYTARGLAFAQKTGIGMQAVELVLPESFAKIVFAQIYPVVDGITKYDQGQPVTLAADRITSNGMEGEWAIELYFEREMRNDTTMELDGSVVNYLDSDAIRKFADVTYARYAQFIDLSKVEAFFTDEPAIQVSNFNWRDKSSMLNFQYVPYEKTLFKLFEQTYGYDIKPHLHSLFGGDAEEDKTVRMQYYQMVANMYANSYTGQLAARANNYGSKLSGHLLLEERLRYHVGYYGNFMTAIKKMDYPGADNLASTPRAYIGEDYEILGTKYVSSAARMKNAKTVMMEYCPVHDVDLYKSDMGNQLKGIVNLMYFAGITHINSYHEASAEVDSKYNAHIGRLSAVLREANHDSKVAVYYPIETMQAAFISSRSYIGSDDQVDPAAAIVDKNLNDLTRAIFNAKLDFNFIDGEAVLDSLVYNGEMNISGLKYKVLIMPYMDVIPLDVLNRIKQFEDNGGTVYWMGKLPVLGTALTDHETVRAEVSEYMDKIRSMEDSSLYEEIKEITQGRIRITEEENARLWASSYVRNDMRIQFVVNTADTVAAMTVDANESLLDEFDVYNPYTGTVKRNSINEEIQIEGYGSVFIVYPLDKEMEYSPVTVKDIADIITSIAAPEKGATSLTLPVVPDGYTLKIKSSSSSVITTGGAIEIPAADTTVSLILTVTRISDSTTADTISISVVVPGVSAEPKSTDATLSDLKVNGITIPGFTPVTTTYTVTLPTGTTSVPAVSATVNAAGKAATVITHAASISGSASVLVTAEDGITTKTYTVNFTVQTVENTGGTSNGSGTVATPAVEAGQIQVKPVLSGATATADIAADDLKKAMDTAKPDSDGSRTATLKVAEVAGAEKYVIELPKASVTDNSKQNLKLESVVGTVVVPGNVFDSDVITGDKVQLLIGFADRDSISDKEIRKAVGNRPVLELSAASEGKMIEWNNPDAPPVVIVIDYKPTTKELKNPEHITVWDIDEAGEAVPVPSARYNAETGKVTFTSTHLGKYAVVYVDKTYSDLDKYSWAKNAIEILASKGIIGGASEEIYAPGSSITRADFIVSLVKALGLNARIDGNFDDIAEGSYYYDAVAIARKLGITSGVGNNRFDPTANISRQDMIVLVEKAMKVAGKALASGSISDISGYLDVSQVSGYAQNAMASFVKEQIMIGSANRLDPKKAASKAETAVIIYNLYNK